MRSGSPPVSFLGAASHNTGEHTKPRLLDLFCGAGGCAKGYQRAGFHVVGVDHRPQPRYPFGFLQRDALDLLQTLLDGGDEWYKLDDFAAIHASPPCKRDNLLARNLGFSDRYEDLIAPTRALLQATGLPYVIENVKGAELRDPVRLNGGGLGLGVDDMDLVRDRYFEMNWPLGCLVPPPCRQRRLSIGVYGGAADGWRRRVKGQTYGVAEQRVAMGINWMSRDELSQAIPPAYTELIGHQLMQHIESRAVAPEAVFPDKEKG